MVFLSAMFKAAEKNTRWRARDSVRFYCNGNYASLFGQELEKLLVNYNIRALCGRNV